VGEGIVLMDQKKKQQESSLKMKKNEEGVFWHRGKRSTNGRKLKEMFEDLIWVGGVQLQSGVV